MLIVKQNRETSVHGQREGNRSREHLPLPAKQQLSIHSNNPNSAPVCLLGEFFLQIPPLFSFLPWKLPLIWRICFQCWIFVFVSFSRETVFPRMRRRAADFRRPVRRRFSNVFWLTLCGLAVLLLILVLSRESGPGSRPPMSKVNVCSFVFCCIWILYSVRLLRKLGRETTEDLILVILDLCNCEIVKLRCVFPC